MIGLEAGERCYEQSPKQCDVDDVCVRRFVKFNRQKSFSG